MKQGPSFKELDFKSSFRQSRLKNMSDFKFLLDFVILYSINFSVSLHIAPQALPYLTINSRHAWPVFLKFEWSFEIYMSVLNIANEISEFP